MMQTADLNSRDGHGLVPRFDDNDLSNSSTGVGVGVGYNHEAAVLPNTAASGQWALAANVEVTHSQSRGLDSNKQRDTASSNRSVGQIDNDDNEGGGHGGGLVARGRNTQDRGTLQNTLTARDSVYSSESCQMSPTPLAADRSNSAVWREAASVSLSNMATLSQSGVDGAALYDDDASRSVFSMHGLSLSNQGLPFEGSNLQPLSAAGDGLSQSMGFPNFDDHPPPHPHPPPHHHHHHHHHHDAVSVGGCTPGSMPLSISMSMPSPGPSSSAQSSSPSSSIRPTGSAAGPSFLDTVMQAIAGDENASSPPAPSRAKEHGKARARGAPPIPVGSAAETRTRHTDKKKKKKKASMIKPKKGASTKNVARVDADAHAPATHRVQHRNKNQWIDADSGLSTPNRGLQELGLESVSNSATSSDRHQLLRHFQQRQLESLSGSMDFGSDDIGGESNGSRGEDAATFTASGGGDGLSSPMCLSAALDQMVFSLNDERSACFGPKDQVAQPLAAAATAGTSLGQGGSSRSGTSSRTAASAVWSDEDIRIFFHVLEEQHHHGQHAGAAFVDRVARLVHKAHGQVQLFFDRKLLYVQRLLRNFDVDCNTWNAADQRRALLCFWNILQQRCGARKGTTRGGGKVNKTEKRLLATKLFKAIHSRPVVAVDRTGSSRSGIHSLEQLAREPQQRLELSGSGSFSRKRQGRAPERPPAKRLAGKANDARPLQERQLDAPNPLLHRGAVPALCPKRRELSRSSHGGPSHTSSSSPVPVPAAQFATPSAAAVIMDAIPRLPLSRDEERRKCLVRLVPHTKKAGRFVALHQRQKLQFRVRMGMTISDIIDKHLPKKWGTVLTAAQADGQQLRLVLVCGGITHASWGSSCDRAVSFNSKAALQDRSSNPRSTISQQKLSSDSNKRTNNKMQQLQSREHHDSGGGRDNTVWDLAQFCAKKDRERVREGASSKVGTGDPRPISLEYYWRRKVQTV